MASSTKALRASLLVMLVCLGFGAIAGGIYAPQGSGGGGGAPTYPLAADDGTAGAPAYSFTNDPDSGMYSGSGDDLVLAQGSLDVLRINQNEITVDINNVDLIFGTASRITGQPKTTDTATADFVVKGADAYESAVSSTDGGDLVLHGGLGTHTVTVSDYTAATGNTVTVTLNGTDTVLTEGVDFTAATSNNATATSLASAIDAIVGLDGAAAAAVVTVDEGSSTTAYTLSLATDDATAFTVLDGTEGTVRVVGASYVFGDLDANVTLTTSTIDVLDDWTASTTLGPNLTMSDNRITVNDAGLVTVCFQARMSSSTVGNRTFYLNQFSSADAAKVVAVDAMSPAASATSIHSFSFTFDCAAGDYVQAAILQSAGGDMTAETHAQTHFSATWHPRPQ